MKKLTLVLSALLLFTTHGPAQDQAKPGEATASPDPYVKKKEEKTAETKEAAITNVGTLFQYIDVKQERWRKWLAENAVPLDAGTLRNEVETWITAGDAALAETSLIMGKSGQRSKVESVRQIQFPAEFSPHDSNLPVPKTYETKNQGTTSEVDPVLGPDGRVDFNFAPERVAYAGENPPRQEPGAEEGDIRWPLFRSQRATTQVNLGAEEWGLVGCETSLDKKDTHQTLIFARPVLHQFEEKPSTTDLDGQGMLTFQWIEVGHGQLNDWLMKSDDISAWIGGTLHTAAMESGATILNERVMRFRSGQRAKNESIEEVSYPTGFSQSGKENEFATATAIDTRNVGITVEVDPVFSAGGTSLDLNMAPEQVFYFGKSVHHRLQVDGAWQSNITMPVFYTMKPTTQMTIPLETPVLVSVMSPPDEKGWIDSTRKVLLFVKVSR